MRDQVRGVDGVHVISFSCFLFFRFFCFHFLYFSTYPGTTHTRLNARFRYSQHDQLISVLMRGQGIAVWMVRDLFFLVSFASFSCVFHIPRNHHRSLNARFSYPQLYKLITCILDEGTQEVIVPTRPNEPDAQLSDLVLLGEGDGDLLGVVAEVLCVGHGVVGEEER